MPTAEVVERRRRRLWLWPLIFFLLLIGAGIAAYEMIASPFQAMFLADYAKRLTFKDAPGKSEQIRFPEAGPYDIRLGYVSLPSFQKQLEAQDFTVDQQARISPEMTQLFDYGLYLPYRERTVAGLTLIDQRGEPFYQFRQPKQAYAEFIDIPPVVANTLLFIENRELLDPNHPARNPAVEWDRLAQAVLEKIMKVFNPGRNVPGGSTLATQIEKYRHSPDGLTLTASDKLTQMASASVRAYLDGQDTRSSRRRIVLDYLNSVPLAAAPGFGEVHGIGEAMDAWFGLDFDKTNALLKQTTPTPEAARYFKHVLGLLISQRKPSYYLLSGRSQLDEQANVHLRLLANAGVITPRMRDLATREHIEFKRRQKKPVVEAEPEADHALPQPVANVAQADSTKPVDAAETQEAATPAPKPRERRKFALHKATNAIRVELAQLLKVPRLYDLDRLDFSASTTLHYPTQRAVADFLNRLDDPAVAEAAGLFGERLLSPENDLSKVIYSFTMYELSARGALLRVQADNFNQPFDINQGAKLDMGSSAKLRTLITYLEIIADLRERYAGMAQKELAKIKVDDKDILTRWAVDYLRQHPSEGRDLASMLHAAMSRNYSASPAEAFYTGGGLHRFANFNNDDNSKVMDLWEATRNSVNLPFIRLMRDIVRHFIYRAPSTALRVLNDAEDPRRQTYLLQFADKEGQEFLARFHKKYKGLKPDEAMSTLLNHLTANPKRLAAVYRYIEPKADAATFIAFMQSRLSNPEAFDEGDYEYLYETYGPDKFNLSERGYITQIHPLELWLAAYVRSHPGAGWKEIVGASAKERVEVYDWLFKAGRKNAQDSRIMSLLEIEAFQEIHKRWRQLGYPFSSLVPSYASAIGSSADRPAALAELLGVILNNGARLPTATLESLDFAANTPYHTRFQRNPSQAEYVFPAPIAQTIQEALLNVVREGTARRVNKAFDTEAGGLRIGGKTGTGDHRYETYSASGQVLESKIMNRVATFAFFIGQKHYGVITAFVPGEAAKDYHFTSGLPVQLLKSMAPALQALLGDEAREVEAAATPPATPPAPATSVPAKPTVPATKPAPAGAAATKDKAAAPPAKPATKPAAPAPAAPPHPAPPLPPPPAPTHPAPEKPAETAPPPHPARPFMDKAAPGQGFNFM